MVAAPPVLIVTLVWPRVMPLKALAPAPVSVTDKAPVVATTLPLKVFAPAELIVTDEPATVPVNVLEPAELKVKVLLVDSPDTAVAALSVSLTFINPDVVLVARPGVLTLRAAAAVPKLPELLSRLTVPVPLLVTTAVPLILPVPLLKMTEFVAVEPPKVAPLRVMPPVPPLVLINIELAPVSV